MTELDYTNATWTDLGVFKRDTDFSHYVIVLWTLVIAFYMVYKMVEYVVPEIMTVYDPSFDKLREKDKKEYFSRIVSNIHAVAALMMGLKCLYASCDEGTLLSNDECLLKP